MTIRELIAINERLRAKLIIARVRSEQQQRK